VNYLKIHFKSSNLIESSGKLVGKLCEYRSSETKLVGYFSEYEDFFLPPINNAVTRSDMIPESDVVNAFNNTTDNRDFIESLKIFVSSTQGSRQSLVEAGVLEPLVNCVQHHIANSRVVYSLVKAVSILAHGDESIFERYQLASLRACEVIVEALRQHISDVNVCIVCSHAIRALCSRNHLTRDQIVNLLSEMHKSEAYAIDESTTLLSDQVEDFNRFILNIQSFNQIHVEKSGGLKLISEAFNLHLNDQFSFSNETSLLSFTSSKVSSKGHQRLYKPTRRNDSLIESMSWSVAKLCENNGTRNRDILGSHGLCELLVDLLNSFSRGLLTFDLTFYIVMALTHLSVKNQKNINRLGFTSIGENLVQIINQYFSHFNSNAETSYQKALPTTAFTKSASISQLKLNESMHDASTDSSKAASTEYDIFMEHIVILSTNICRDRVGQHRLGEAGICRLACILLSRYDRSYMYSSMIIQLIAALAWQFPDNQNRLGSAGVCKILLSVLEKYIYTQGKIKYVNITTTNGLPIGKTSITNTKVDDNIGHDIREKPNPTEKIDVNSDDSVSEERDTGMSFENKKDNLPQIEESSEVKRSHDSANKVHPTHLHTYDITNSRPSHFIDGFAAISSLARGNESNRSKFQTSIALDILTKFLAIDDNDCKNDAAMSLAKACAKEAMDAIMCD
jgi:hypothetical protein